MNSKIPSLFLAVLTSGVMFTYAHETGVPHDEPVDSQPVEVQLVPLSAEGRRPVTSGGQGSPKVEGSAPLQRGLEARPVIRVASGSVQSMPDQLRKVTTGDPALDAEVQALTLEMEAKVKAIRDEYSAKIRVLIANKKGGSVYGTSTRNQIRNDTMHGSTTEPRRSPGVMRGVLEGISSETSQLGGPQNNLIRSLLQRMFGQ